jgi:hypothetical protein
LTKNTFFENSFLNVILYTLPLCTTEISIKTLTLKFTFESSLLKQCQEFSFRSWSWSSYFFHFTSKEILPSC